MRRLIFVGLILFITAMLFARGGGEEEIILRVGSSSNDPAAEAIFENNIAQFETEHPGVKVEWDSSSGDDYEFAGLPSMLQSDTPPDIYSEWGGNRSAITIWTEKLWTSQIWQPNSGVISAALPGPDSSLTAVCTEYR